MLTIEKSLEQMQLSAKDTNESLKVMLAEGFQESQDASGRRFWSNPDHAKQFGEMVLKVLGKQKAMDETSFAGGEAVVPGELQDRIIQKLGVYGKYRRDATHVTLGSAMATVPKITGDLTVYCPGQSEDIDESDITFGQVNLVARTFACLAAVSNELEEDAIGGIGEILGVSMTRSMAKQEDLIGFMGDGTSTYFAMRGIVGALRAVNATIGDIAGLKVASGNAYSEITLADFEGVVALLPEECEDTAKWYMSKGFYYAVVAPLVRAVGIASMFDLLTDRKVRYFMGYEVVFVSAMPSTEANSQICAVLGDLQLGAYLGERKHITIDKSGEWLFKSNQVGVRGIERIDINAFGVGDTSEPGPIIGLITAAS